MKVKNSVCPSYRLWQQKHQPSFSFNFPTIVHVDLPPVVNTKKVVYGRLSIWCALPLRYPCHLCSSLLAVESQLCYCCVSICSITLGGFGADRFYLGQWREGLGKLFSFGGLGIWTLIDVLLIGAGYVGPADGSLYIWDLWLMPTPQAWWL